MRNERQSRLVEYLVTQVLEVHVVKQDIWFGQPKPEKYLCFSLLSQVYVIAIDSLKISKKIHFPVFIFIKIGNV